MENKMGVLSDCKIVDLNRSKWNKEKSDPKKNRYVFDEKRYMTGTSQAEDNVFFSWCLYVPKSGDGLLMFEDWRMNGWEPVIQGVDPYVVEGASVNVDHYWQFKDVVLMRCKFEDEVKRAEDRDKASRRGAKAALKSFAREIDAMGGEDSKGAGIGPDEIARMRGKS
jgi:hypothetical protein